MLLQDKSDAGTCHDQFVARDQVPFDRMRDKFASAIATAGAVTLNRQYSVAGYAVRVRVVGKQLVEQTKHALAHLRGAQSPTCALTIDLWDEQAAGVSWPRDRPRDTPDVLMMMRATDDGQFVCEERLQGEHWLDRSNHRIVGCTRSADQRHLDERARPFHKLLATWLNDRGIQFVHSGLISIAGKGVLFAGHGGAGKSTSSIACLRAGFEYLGDDFIGIERKTDGSFMGYGLYASCLLDVHHMKRFPDLLPYAHLPFHPHEEKAVFYLADAFPRALRDKVTIDAIALPRVVDTEHTHFERASPKQALLALAPTSVMLLPVPTAKAFHVLAQLVEDVPVYWLKLGRDVNRIPEAVEQLVRGVGG